MNTEQTKQQTAVEWLFEELNIWQTIADEDTNATLDTVRKLLEQAKQMEKEQVEISDEEILKAAKECVYEDLDISVGSFELGARWYREQLKKR